MDAEEALPRVGVFLGVLVLTALVLGAAVAGGGGDAPAVRELRVDAYAGPDVVAPVPDPAGEVTLSADAAGEVVVVDAGHGAEVERGELEPLVRTLAEDGARIRYFVGDDRRTSLADVLEGADAYVALGAEDAYTSAEVDSLAAFADRGGRILLLREPAETAPGGTLVVIGGSGGPDVPRPMAPLASRFGLSFGTGYLYDMANYDTNYRNVYATPVAEGPLTAGVDRLVLHEALPVAGQGAVVRTEPTAELSTTREPGRYAVVVRSGNVAAVGDVSVVSEAFYRRADNEVLLGNLLTFLVSGETRPADGSDGPTATPNGTASGGPPGAGNGTTSAD